MSCDPTYRQAKKRAEAKLGFFIHFAVYLIVNALLVVINLMTTPECLWFIWALLGWGVGLFCHGFAVFFLSDGAPLKQRLIEREMHKQRSDSE